MAVLLERGHRKSEVASLLRGSAGTARYREKRMKSGPIGERSL